MASMLCIKRLHFICLDLIQRFSRSMQYSLFLGRIPSDFITCTTCTCTLKKSNHYYVDIYHLRSKVSTNLVPFILAFYIWRVFFQHEGASNLGFLKEGVQFRESCTVSFVYLKAVLGFLNWLLVHCCIVFQKAGISAPLFQSHGCKVKSYLPRTITD